LKALKPAAQSGQQPLEDVSIDRTLSLIDAFLATVPTEVQENDTIEMDYAVDYTAYLMNEGEEPTAISEAASEPNLLKGQNLIDDFIEQSESADKEKSLRSLSDIKPAPQTEADELDETCFTETLAKIYVKQQRYDKALEIIRKLSLNYPKKNAYFADQIRFLEKLIINAKFKQ
jgi:predicted Zn-dependent protease